LRFLRAAFGDGSYSVPAGAARGQAAADLSRFGDRGSLL